MRLELETALAEGRSRQLRIVPVLVDCAPRPDERRRLPDPVKDITPIHTLPLRTATRDEWKAGVARIVADIGIAGRGRTREDVRSDEWVAEHLQRLTVRVAERLSASAPVLSGFRCHRAIPRRSRSRSAHRGRVSVARARRVSRPGAPPCDLDPGPRAAPHPRARRGPGGADHALRIRELLSPGLDTSFVATFTEELGALPTTDEASAQLIAELRQRLAAPVQSSI